MKKVLNLPLTYEEVGFKDERFTKVRVKVQHNGLNLNKSNFSDESIGKAAPSLRNVPLLAFVKKTDGTDQADFAGHEFEFKITEDGIKYIYLGRPIGMVPETNNYAYGEDEEGLKYVSADAYIWNQYANEALEIIRRDGGKSVSMEITVDNFEVDGDAGVLDITDFKYTGIAILGDDVQPAMRNARLDLSSFSFNGISDFMATFSKEIKETLSDEKSDAPRGIPVAEVNIITEADSEEENTKEDGRSEDAPAMAREEQSKDTENVSPASEEEREEIISIIEPEETIEPLIGQKDETEDETQPKVAEKDSPIGDPVSITESGPDPLGESTSIVGETSPSPLGVSTLPFSVTIDKKGMTVGSDDYTAIKAENEALKSEIEKLRAFKVAAEKAEFDTKVAELIKDFSDLPKEDVNNIVLTESNYEIIELKLYAMRGRLNTKTPANKIQSYVIYDSIPKQDKPAWEALVENYKNKKSTQGGN